MNIQIQKKFTFGIRVIVWVVPLLFLGWLLNRNFVPGGTFTVHFVPGQENALVSNFATKEPYQFIGTEPDTGDAFQLITESPVYFTVKTPRPFPKVNVQVTYRNPDTQPELRLGIRQSNDGYVYTDLAYHEPTLENLGPYWLQIREGDTVLYQKNTKYYDAVSTVEQERDKWLVNLEKKYGNETELLTGRLAEEYNAEKALINQRFDKEQADVLVPAFTPAYDSVNSFLVNPPSFSQIANYKYDLSSIWELPGYHKDSSLRMVSSSIRGSHAWYTYIGPDEELYYRLTLQDLNRHDGADDVHITVYNSVGGIIHEQVSGDDGVEIANGEVTPERVAEVRLDDLPFGVYSVQVDIADDDVMIKKIESTQSYFSFRQHVYLTDNQEYESVLQKKSFSGTTLYTDSTQIRFRTAHDNGLQSVFVNGKAYAITATHELIRVDDLSGISEVKIPQNDVYIEGDGIFSYSQSNFFNPSSAFASDLESVGDVDTYNYIIAQYPEKKEENGWYVAHGSFEVPKLYMGNQNSPEARFIISMPGLHENDRTLYIKEINITFTKDSITVENFFKRLFKLIER